MKSYFLLAFISLFGLVVAGMEQEARSADEYEKNFLEYLRKDVESIEDADKSDIQSLGDAIYGPDTKGRWDFFKLPNFDLARGVIKFLEDKTGKRIDEHSVKNVDDDLQKYVNQLCARISSHISDAMDVCNQNPYIYKSNDDKFLHEWISIGQFCEDESYFFGNDDIERFTLGEEAVPYEFSSDDSDESFEELLSSLDQ